MCYRDKKDGGGCVSFFLSFIFLSLRGAAGSPAESVSEEDVEDEGNQLSPQQDFERRRVELLARGRERLKQTKLNQYRLKKKIGRARHDMAFPVFYHRCKNRMHINAGLFLK
ncbi:hypothetical protein KIL84_009196 [Mauremys mutica]|uniref:Uncharacterized protein n=1 Tax=Mauremys mutica TaxID=74926 RepID=A0A9D4B4X7_9SAUR|nr:hypothetical protein KIL84_009196 [Mauremys mutica]